MDDREREFYKQLPWIFVLMVLWLFSEAIVDFLVSL